MSWLVLNLESLIWSWVLVKPRKSCRRWQECETLENLFESLQCVWRWQMRRWDSRRSHRPYPLLSLHRENRRISKKCNIARNRIFLVLQLYFSYSLREHRARVPLSQEAKQTASPRVSTFYPRKTAVSIRQAVHYYIQILQARQTKVKLHRGNHKVLEHLPKFMIGSRNFIHRFVGN